MRIAFYAPLKSPDHAVPSGDRQVGRLLVDALERAGHIVELASPLRAYEPAGDAARQVSLREQGTSIARDLITRWREPGTAGRPDLWFTYHLYYKAPDWLGPAVSKALGIPYIVAEASFAPKRAAGPWSLGHAASGEAIRAASLILCPIQDDLACLQPLVSPGAKIVVLPPFLDSGPYRISSRKRAIHRRKLAASLRLDPTVPWIVVAAMMRVGDKESSYRMLASTLRRLTDIRWQVLVAGDGAVRSEIEAAFERAAPGRARFLGEAEPGDLAALYCASDLSIWPAVNEAYGMAMLEAQAAGVPVVSRRIRGVPDVVCNGRTGLLAAPDDATAFARLSRGLLVDSSRRRKLGRAAARFARIERSVDAASAILDRALMEIRAEMDRSPVARQR
jgi:glycosyltransferase involved in cell wall biosynthesis